MRFQTLQFILVGVVIAALCGCTYNKSNENETPVLKAYRLIDQQRSDEAIEIMERALEAEPDNYEYKVTLASAYSHKAGLKIQKLVPVILKAQESEQNRTQLEKKLSISTNAQNDQAQKYVINLVTLLMQFSGYIETYRAIPEIDADKVIYLKYAVQLLYETGNQIKKSDALLRSIMNVVLFKHIVAKNFMYGSEIRPEGSYEECNLDFKKINEKLEEPAKILIDVFSDVGLVYPDQAVKMNENSMKVTDSVGELLTGAVKVAEMDQASKIFLARTSSQYSLGQFVLCKK